MGLFDFLGDVSTVASPGLEAYGKGRLAEATTTADLINRYINNRVRLAKFDFTREKEIERRRQFGVTTAQRERGLQLKEAGIKPLSVKEQVQRKAIERGVQSLNPAEYQIYTASLQDPFGFNQFNLPVSEPSTAYAEEGQGGGFLGGPTPPSAPGILGRINEAVPGPTVRDVTSGIQSLLTPKYEPQPSITPKQSVQALAEGIIARRGGQKDVGAILRAISAGKVTFDRVANLLNKGATVSEILSAREFRTARHNR